MARTVAIIQARMGSTRFPGKVLRLLCGKPILWHIIYRLKKSRLVDDIVIATSVDKSNDILVDFSYENGVKIVRGPEENILERYLLAVDLLHPDILVRVTGDCPLVDPYLIDCLVEKLIETGADYCTGEKGVPCIHEGFDQFTVEALKKLVAEAGEDPIAREHVSSYFKVHEDFVKTAYVSIDPAYHFSGARISVDTPSDIRFLEEVYTCLSVPAGEADVRDVVTLLRSQPKLLEINSHVRQKGASEKGLRIVIRCDGDSQIGLGHVYRCIALAEELRDKHSCSVTFAMDKGAAGFDLVKIKIFPIEYKDTDKEDIWLNTLIDRLQPEALILDICSQLTPESIDKWRTMGILVVTIDDPSERRCSANLAFYPPAPQLQKMDWTGTSVELHVGWEWVILRNEFSEFHPRNKGKRPVVLVTMGGSDPAGLTLKAVKSLDLLDEDFETMVVLGSAFSDHKALKSLLEETRREFNIIEKAENMSKLMAKADLAVASFGVTAYELAAVGVPSIILCLSQDHVQSASIFVEAEMAICMGISSDVKVKALSLQVKNLLKNEDKRAKMSLNCKKIMDGQGTKRIANLIYEKAKRSIIEIGSFSTFF